MAITSVNKARAELPLHRSAKSIIGAVLRVHSTLDYAASEAIADEIAIALIRAGHLLPGTAGSNKRRAA